jgi:mono/diheme cytochrome c family protein
MVWRRCGVLVALALVAPLLLAAHAVSAQSKFSGDASKGREVYIRYCSGCHGDDGRGEAKTFRPNVGNLSVKQLMDELSDEYLFIVIQKGGAAVGKNAAMPAWSAQLGDDDIRDVVAFVRTLSRR